MSRGMRGFSRRGAEMGEAQRGGGGFFWTGLQDGQDLQDGGRTVHGKGVGARGSGEEK